MCSRVFPASLNRPMAILGFLSFLILLSVMMKTTLGEEVFASSEELLLLDQTENDLTDALKRYLDNERWRLEQLQQSVKFIILT